MARGPSGCGRWHETPPRPPGPRAHERRRSLTAGATSAAAAVRGQRASPRPPGLASWLYRGARMRIRLSLGRRGILQGARGSPYHEERKETRNKFCVQFYSFENLYFFGHMDNLDKIAIRFHFGEAFDNVDGLLLYVGGDIAKSWIDEDKLSFFEMEAPS
ncbi:unnamed protein product [Miscanthus lutarioriparius]|uniref:Uncharacterized protein n=1 Tax=Miscanthus lutarioriparius TaxID=422564 RepID=A0A811PNC8_9POAL|nr:unnamed protein product [Miscanthus lutarioriparius]